MKQSNFPGRKNLRRIKARSRLLKSGKHGDEVLTLTERIMPEETARAIRTKKVRAKG